MTKRFASGSKAWGLCQRCGQRFKLHALQSDGRQRNLLVCTSCWDPKEPLDVPPRINDPTALRRPSPENSVGQVAVISWPSLDLDANTTFFGSGVWASPVATTPTQILLAGMQATFFDDLEGIFVYAEVDDVYVKQTTPNPVPGRQQNRIATSPNHELVATVTSHSPFIFLYRRTEDGIELIPDQPPSPLATSGSSCAFSPDGERLVVVHGNTAPRIVMYEVSGEELTPITPTFDTLIGGGLGGVAFSVDGSMMAIASENSPFFAVYEVNAGDSFSKLANPLTLPPSFGFDVAFSPDGSMVAVAHQNSPWFSIYSIDGGVLTKLPNPSIVPGGTGRRCKFSPDGMYFAVAHVGGIFSVYRIDGSTLTKLNAPVVAPLGLPWGIDFSGDSLYIAVSCEQPGLGDGLYVYRIDGEETLTHIPLSEPLLRGGRTVSFSPSSLFGPVPQ